MSKNINNNEAVIMQDGNNLADYWLDMPDGNADDKCGFR